MGIIRQIEIDNFRCIHSFKWNPSPGINCLIGSGDSGKSTVLEAIDLCLGARRTVQFGDPDFHKLDIDKPIRIRVTVGGLDDTLKNLDLYGYALRGFNCSTREVLAEPHSDAEPVLTVQLIVASDLDPQWSIYSERLEESDQSKSLPWGERVRLAPTRLGVAGDFHLSWRRGSILTRLSDEEADIAGDLSQAIREARNTFGDKAKDKVLKALEVVQTETTTLGIKAGQVTALLDSQSLSFAGGSICLHSENGVPLRGLGLGSTRLLISGLQKKGANGSGMILIDEVEHGLEPHRIIRLLTSLGAKDKDQKLQVFMTTHSPVVLKELSSSQLFVLRRTEQTHEARWVGEDSDMQATMRACAEAFLAPNVIICEGSSEYGLLRGIDLYRVDQGEASLTALGVAAADGKGSSMFARTRSFIKLGYRTLLLKDNDKQKIEQTIENEFQALGVPILKCQEGRALEDELFQSLPDEAILQLLDYAVELKGEDLVDSHIRSADKDRDLKVCRELITLEVRVALATAAKSKSNAWFKNVTAMEHIGRTVVAPCLKDCSEPLQLLVKRIFSWCSGE